MSTKQKILIAHSPDSDDAFMFHALKHGLVSSPKYECDIERRDIEELNQLAIKEHYDITAISIHAYAHLHDKYVLTSSGCSMAEKDWGPTLIARHHIADDDLKNCTIAVPGMWTTAALVLKIIVPEARQVVVPFEKIMGAVKDNHVDAGLLIHEGQLQYKDQGFTKIFSLIDHWKQWAGDLPLPLGGSAIKKSLGNEVIAELSALQKESIQYAMNNPEAARDYAMSFKRDLTTEEADKYLSWYANNRTLDLGTDGRKAIDLLFQMAYEKQLLPNKIKVEII